MEADQQSNVPAVFEPIVEAGKWVVSLIPRGVRVGKPHVNFIAVHYMFIIGSTIACAIILYGAGFMSFTNAIFFGAGSTTQSGLNPLNLNDLLLYQQVTMMLFSCICNPIFINTFVVFVRLYWFEKRFARIVKESRALRKSKSRIASRSRSQMREDPDGNEVERGVNGRRIRVLHRTTLPNGMNGSATNGKTPEQQEFVEKMGLSPDLEVVTPRRSSDEAGGSGEQTSDTSDTAHQDIQEVESPPSPTRLHRDITFADEIQTPADQSQPKIASDSEDKDLSKHIAFIQRQQREAHDGTAIRIPGPRDFDRGEIPQALNTSSDDFQRRLSTTDTNTTAPREKRLGRRSTGDRSVDLHPDSHPIRKAITFGDSEHPARQRASEEPDSGRPETAGTHLRRGYSRSRLSLNEARSTIGRTFTNLTTARSKERNFDPMPYLSYEATVGRNSAFLALTAEQRDELGGIEYRALKTLAKVLIIYYIGFHIFGMLCYVPWIFKTKRWRTIVTSDGVQPGWWGVFTAASAFTDLGFTLTPNSMNSFAESTFVLLIGSFLIIIGNTGFPVMLRFVIWIASKAVPYGSATWEELRFLLDHPRRCFTLLFPAQATWWLFWILVLFNGLDLIFYIILDINVNVVDVKPAQYRVLDGWFQATSTRTAGFSCVNIADLHPAIQVSYMIMMYISVFPIAISVRRTNVYEERSLGLWGGEEVSDEADANYVPQHLRRQLSFDLWYIFLGFFIICIVEGTPLQDSSLSGFSMFSVLFEIVSAYGTVGLSLGYPGTDTSFSAQFKVISKLVIAAMMIRGRHRGLPYALDRAILLPSETDQKSEQEDNDRRYKRRGSVFAETSERHPARLDRWRDMELDINGLPKQHNGDSRPTTIATGVDVAMTAGAGGERIGDDGAAIATTSTIDGLTSSSPPPQGISLAQRRGSTLSASGTRGRSRNLSRALLGALSAGPTLPDKREE